MSELQSNALSGWHEIRIGEDGNVQVNEQDLGELVEPCQECLDRAIEDGEREGWGAMGMYLVAQERHIANSCAKPSVNFIEKGEA